MSYESNLDVQQLLKIFPPQAIAGGLQMRNRILDDVLGIFDRIGWRRLDQLVFEEANQAGATTQVTSSTVPRDKVRVVTYANLDHSDAASRSLAFAIQVTDTAGAVKTIALSPWFLASGAQAHALPRSSVVLPPGSILIGVADPAVAAGFNFQIRMLFVDIPVGEYLLL